MPGVDVDVAIVGAGLAGSTAARTLVEGGKTVSVLEARDRVAGRNHGAFLSNGVPVEMRGQWVGPTQDAVLGLIKELGLETFVTYDEGATLTVIEASAYIPTMARSGFLTTAPSRWAVCGGRSRASPRRSPWRARWTEYGPALAEPIGRIHWAGSETSDVWNGSMDGAVRSGRRSASEVLAELG